MGIFITKIKQIFNNTKGLRVVLSSLFCYSWSMKKRQAFKFRLKPSVADRILFARFAGSCRLVWNKTLALQKERLDRQEKIFSFSDSCKLLTDWKKELALSFLKDCHSQPLQQTLKALDRALKDAFNKSDPKDFPRFKKRGKKDSFRYPQGFKVDEPNSRVYLPKIGWVRYRRSRQIIGTPKNITISKKGDNWFVSIQTEREVEAPIHSSTSMVGGDLGIARFLTLSTGEFFAPLNRFKVLEKQLARLQKTLARREKEANNRQKIKRKIAKLHIKIANARHDYLHKLSHYISKNHAVVVLEDLKVANMSKSAKGTIDEPGTNVTAKSGLNKSILDQGWHEFKRQLTYKLEWLGGMLVLVNPKNTSRCCPECGHTSGENRKTQSTFKCVECDYQNNADLVGALNVLKRAGHAQIACGDIDLIRGLAQEPAQIAAFG